MGVFGVISAVGLPEWDLLLSDHFNRRGQQLRDGSRRGTAGLMHDAAAASGPYAVPGPVSGSASPARRRLALEAVFWRIWNPRKSA